MDTHNHSHRNEFGILYVVATPIGNLNDITLRAIETLRAVDLIAAEDTRNSAILMRHYAIDTKLIALHQHNEQRAAERLIALLESGQQIALISDAGTPGISDPGALTVSLARKKGIRVVPIPGANAAITALSASGLLDPHFLFYGFLPAKAAARRKALESLSSLSYPLVFYEAPHRVAASVVDMANLFGGERELTVARELTKTFETIYRCQLSEAPARLMADSHQQKGEFVLIVQGAYGVVATEISAAAKETLVILLSELPLKQAVSLAAKISGENKNPLYDYALQLQKETTL